MKRKTRFPFAFRSVCTTFAEMMTYADIILPVPLHATFTYSVPEGMCVGEGMRVLVSFGRNKKYVGIVDRLHHDKPEHYEVKPLLQVMDPIPIVNPSQLKLWHWIADYYLSPIGDVYKVAMPAGLKAEEGYKPKTETYIRLTPAYRNEASIHVAINMLTRAQKQLEAFNTYLFLSHWDEVAQSTPIAEVTREELMNSSHATSAIISQLEKRGMLETYEVEVGRLNHGGDYHPELIPPLSEAQTTAYNSLLMQMMGHPVTLLHGVTGSGKTEIYIHLIRRALEHKQQVLYLLPEIALTVQMMQRLQRVFGDRLGIYHSKYSDAERVEIWQKQLSSHPYDIILGARSAVLLPFQKLGLVIVDEEHENSYKQQDPAPRYHARSAAIVLAHMTGAKTVLGTATPSMETYYNTQTGKYGLVSLTQRFQGMQLPRIEVVDVARLQHRKEMKGPFSPLLLTSMREALQQGEQVILFQNRRGFAPMVECHQCGWVPRCQHCDVSLTLHRQTNQLTCHYCGYTYQIPDRCPCCESKDLRSRGFGTEKIEEQIRDLFPEARIARMDLDTTRTRNAYERIISDFGAGRTNILIGTQMVTKGLDFERVSVVGILDADGMLSQPDFRSHERAFQMMEQVAGRAGRKGGQGHVILQTRDAQSPVVQQVVAHDYQAMYEAQMQERELFNYPPLCRLVSVYVKHRDERTADALGRDMAQLARRTFGERVLGPDTPPIGRIQLMYIRKVLVKIELTASMSQARDYLRQIQRYLLALPQYKGAQVYYDVD